MDDAGGEHGEGGDRRREDRSYDDGDRRRGGGGGGRYHGRRDDGYGGGSRRWRGDDRHGGRRGGRDGDRKGWKGAGGGGDDGGASSSSSGHKPESRRKDIILSHVHKLVQWAKRFMIQEESRPAVPVGVDVMDVMDLCCGKGWDFNKWREVSRKFKIGRFIGVDTSKPLLEEAVKTYTQNKELRKALGGSLMLAVADPGVKDLWAEEVMVWDGLNQRQGWRKSVLLDESDEFDVISMHSSLHLILQSEAHARRCFSTIASLLRLGGTFHATTMDARVVVELLQSHSHYNEENQTWVARHVDEEGRELCGVEVDKEVYEQIFRRDPGKPCPVYGLKYHFHWGQEEEGGSGGSGGEKSLAWLLPLPMLRSIGEEYGLSLEYAKNLQELVGWGRNKTFPFLNYRGTLSEVDWEIARLYMALKFTRVYTE